MATQQHAVQRRVTVTCGKCHAKQDAFIHFVFTPGAVAPALKRLIVCKACGHRWLTYVRSEMCVEQEEAKKT